MTKKNRSHTPTEEFDGLSWSRRQRLRYLEALVYWRGSFRRGDLLERFEIGMQRISDDIQLYVRLNPGAVIYDRNEKLYRAQPGMKPVFGAMNLEDALGLLGPRAEDTGPWCDRVKLPARKVNLKVQQQLFRVVAREQSIEVRYASLNSASFRWRWITPHAFAHDGYRWHVRAFCHEERRFKDFVIGRIAATRGQGEAGAKAGDDHEWTQSIHHEVAAAPELGAAELRALSLDFGLRRRKLVIQSRAALLNYALAQLGLDPLGKPTPRRFVTTPPSG